MMSKWFCSILHIYSIGPSAAKNDASAPKHGPSVASAAGQKSAKTSY